MNVHFSETVPKPQVDRMNLRGLGLDCIYTYKLVFSCIPKGSK